MSGPKSASETQLAPASNPRGQRYQHAMTIALPDQSITQRTRSRAGTDRSLRYRQRKEDKRVSREQSVASNQSWHQQLTHLHIHVHFSHRTSSLSAWLSLVFRNTRQPAVIFQPMIWISTACARTLLPLYAYITRQRPSVHLRAFLFRFRFLFLFRFRFHTPNTSGISHPDRVHSAPITSLLYSTNRRL